MTIRILTICTGNVCRSPMAAQLLSSRLDPERFATSSVGTSALVGEHMTDQAQVIATRMGVRGAANHRAVALSEDALEHADLVLGMDLGHRSRAAQIHPNAVRRAFTLMEFAHVVSQMRNERLSVLADDNQNVERAALEAVMRMRGTVPRLTPERLYDVEDPYGRSRQVYERSPKRVETAVDQIVDFFRRIRNLSETRIEKEQPWNS